MDPLELAMLALEGIKVGKGLFDNAQGNQIADSTPRPVYGLPSAETEYLRRANNLTQAELPGMSQAENRIQGATSSGIRSLTEAGNNPAAIMQAVAALNQNQNTANNALNTQDAQFKLGNEQNYQGALRSEIADQNYAFDYNKNQPYQNAMTAARALKGSGIQNAYQGITDLAGTALGGRTAPNNGMNVNNTNFNNTNFTPEQLYNIWKFRQGSVGTNGLGAEDYNGSTSNIV